MDSETLAYANQVDQVITLQGNDDDDIDEMDLSSSQIHGVRSEEESNSPTPTDWARHKEEIAQLYAVNNLKYVMKIMKKRHNFTASENQYKRQFAKVDWREVVGKNSRRKQATRRPQRCSRIRTSTRTYDDQSEGSGIPGSQPISQQMPSGPNFAVYMQSQSSETVDSSQNLASLRRVYLGNHNQTHLTGSIINHSVAQPHSSSNMWESAGQGLFFTDGLLGAPGHFNHDPTLFNSDRTGFFSPFQSWYNSGQFPIQQNSSHISEIDQLNSIHENIPEGSPQAAPISAKNHLRQPIHYAVQAGSLPIVKYLIAKRPECADRRDERGISPLWIASHVGHTQIVRLLIEECKVEVNCPSFSQRTPLHEAAQCGHTEIVEILLEHHATPDPRDREGVTPLFLAAESGYCEIVSILLARNEEVEINVMSSDGRTPLHQASQNGHISIVKKLLEKGPRTDTRDRHGITPLYNAAHYGHTEIVRLLLSRGADKEVMTTTGSGRRPLHRAASNGHLEVCKLLLEFGASHETLDDTHRSPLFFASRAGHADVVELLLGEGADPNNSWDGPEGRGRSCLHQAAQNGHIKVVELLLGKGAVVDPEIEGFGSDADDFPEDDGKASKRKQKIKSSSATRLKRSKVASPLCLAAAKGHLDIAKLLIKHDADVNATDKDGDTPLHLAIYSKNEDLVQILVKHDSADVDAVNHQGASPILYAAQNGKANIMGLLLDADADPDIKAGDGITALLMASELGHTVCVKLLLEKGAKHLPLPESGSYPVHLAARQAHFEILKLFVEKDPTWIHLKDKSGGSVLGWACSGKEAIRLSMVEYLCDKGAKIFESEDQ